MANENNPNFISSYLLLATASILALNAALLSVNSAILCFKAAKVKQVRYDHTKDIASRIVDFYGNNDGVVSDNEWRLIYDIENREYHNSPPKGLEYKHLRDYIRKNKGVIPKI